MKSSSSIPTRDRLVATAKILLAEVGYDGTTMRLLADRIGVKQPVIYYYFDDKDALMREAFVMVQREIRAALAALPAVSDPHELLRQRVSYQIENAALIMAMLNFFLASKRSGGAGGPGSFIPPQAYRHIQEAIEYGIECGVYSTPDVVRDSRIIVHAINGFAMEYFPKAPKASDPSLLDEIVDFVERALRVPAATPLIREP
jgi:AcrR family transcriptional regulator